MENTELNFAAQNSSHLQILEIPGFASDFSGPSLALAEFSLGLEFSLSLLLMQYIISTADKYAIRLSYRKLGDSGILFFAVNGIPHMLVSPINIVPGKIVSLCFSATKGKILAMYNW